MKDFSRINELLDSYKQEMIETMRQMISIKAISPKSGGSGEAVRAQFLEKLLNSWGFPTKRYDYNDDTGTVRPNIITAMGNSKSTIWFVAHMDTVSEGDPKLWKSDPFTLKVDGDILYGRGVNDDGHGLIASMYAMRALKDSGAAVKYNFGLALVADEEIGSRYGMSKLVDEDIFKKGDMFIVPDWGSKDGSLIEIGEKGLLWLKVTVIGKQVHASTPDLGKNAFRYSMRFLAQVDSMLHSKYTARNNVFNPDVSTFEMTKHEKNVDSVNIIPGVDVFYIDCRILPDYNMSEVVSSVKQIASSAEFKEVKIEVEEANRQDPAPITDPNSDIVRLLDSSVTELRKVKTRKLGIGGATCAEFARKKGFQAAVWGTQADVAHQPNEYSDINEIIADAKVFAHMLI